MRMIHIAKTYIRDGELIKADAYSCIVRSLRKINSSDNRSITIHCNY